MKRTCWLSVDFDFFVRSLLDWDWAHKESPFFRGGFLWQTRVAPFLAQGMDLVAEMDPRRYAKPQPIDFWEELQRLGYNFDAVEEFVVADSHAGATPFFNQIADMNLGEPADVVVNFDAHHDLGYCEWARVRELIDAEQCTCDMWLGSLLNQWPSLEARVVFPDWMRAEWTLEEQLRSVRQDLPRSIWSRVELDFFTNRAGKVSNLVIAPGEELEVQAVFACRSGAWVPPWLDNTFIDFAYFGEDAIGLEPYDAFAEQDVPALEAREDFDLEQAKLLGEQWRTLLEQGPQAATELAKKHQKE